MNRAVLLFPGTLLVSLALIFLLGPSGVAAQVGCPSAEMSCSDLDYQGGCQPPCRKAVTRSGGPGGRGAAVQAKCVCIIPEAHGSKSCGERCNIDSECHSSCPFCTPTGFNTPPVCASERWQPGEPPLQVRPEKCVGSSAENPILKTALGCIPTSPGNLIAWLLKLGVGFAGGIAFLLMIWGAFLFITSQGNPEQLQHAKEILVSAIAGLFFIIFAIFILRLIGVDILKIPGFA